MKVRLIKYADYEFDTEKLTSLPSEVFRTLVGTPIDGDWAEKPDVVVFDNKDKYLQLADTEEIDMDKNFFVSSKGQIFCYLKKGCNATADTEEDKGEES